ncbi:unnamed protein product [Arctogadus glacialis]
MLSTRVGKMMEELHLPNGSPGDGRRGGGPDGGEVGVLMEERWGSGRRRGGGPDGGEVGVLMEERWRSGRRRGGGPDGGEVGVLMEESHTHCSSLEGRVPQSDLTSCLSDACELSLDPTPSQQTAVSEDDRQRQPSSP